MQLHFRRQYLALAWNFAVPPAISLVSGIIVLAISGAALAMNASPHAFEEVQPDGTPVRLHVRGNEYYHWLEDMDGYTVVLDEPTREYRYAAVILTDAWAQLSFWPGRIILPMRA